MWSDGVFQSEFASYTQRVGVCNDDNASWFIRSRLNGWMNEWMHEEQWFWEKIMKLNTRTVCRRCRTDPMPKPLTNETRARQASIIGKLVGQEQLWGESIGWIGPPLQVYELTKVQQKISWYIFTILLPNARIYKTVNLIYSTCHSTWVWYGIHILSDNASKNKNEIIATNAIYSLSTLFSIFWKCSA